MEEPNEIVSWNKISVLGSGGFGVVSLWQHKTTFDYIAIKKCKFHLPTALSDKQKKRWQMEVTIMQQINHPNIVSFKQLPKDLEKNLSHFNPTKLPLLSMEYCRRGNLRHILNQAGNSSGLDEPQVRAILTDVTNGLNCLHQMNITHRDIKPENIVLQDDDNNGIVYKIIDLGYAKELNDATVSFVGTLHYLAPEILKNENYNHSVDYWSLGVMLFEIVCGLVPFLPHATPFERFRHIEKKKQEHICIYKSFQSDNVVYSTELMKENHVSTVLKDNFQVWLKHVFSLDASKRSETFPGGVSVFDYLKNALNKQVITIFSVYTLEFYSYEINDGILISTLKNWIARDTKVQSSEQILLSVSNNCFATENNDFYVHNVFKLDELLFVYKNGAFINRATFNLPKHIQWLFRNITSAFQWRDIRQIYAKSLFYLVEEQKLLIDGVVGAVKINLNYLDHLNAKLKARITDLIRKTNEILIKINCYFHLRMSALNVNVAKVGSRAKFRELNEIQTEFQTLVEEFHDKFVDINACRIVGDNLINRKVLLDRFAPRIAPMLTNCDIKVQIAGVKALFAKGSSQEHSCRDIVKLVADAIKKKDKLLNNRIFQGYYKAASVAIKDVDDMLTRIDSLMSSIERISQQIDLNQKKQQLLLITSTLRLTDNNEENFAAVSSIDSDELIQVNRDLRCEFEEILSKLFVDHKNYFV